MTNKKNKKKEASLISYSVLIDSKGRVLTEQNISEINKIKDKLNPILFATLNTIIRIAKEEFKKIHGKIESELDSRLYKD